MTTDSPVHPRLTSGPTALAAAALVLLVLAVYLPVRHAGFLSMDDTIYITENPAVVGGLTAEGLRYAIFSTRGALWMPLTFTSHMLDVSVFGLDPAGPHLVNVAFHAANALLLLLLLVRATGRLTPSVVVAALFALHPLRVESIAWIAERKDVLSVFFGLLALHACVSHARRPTFGRYLVVLLCTVLALLSKPMLVTLPALMLLMDVWPLRRLDGGAGFPRASLRDLVLEKTPLFLLAGAAAAITLASVQRGAALVDLGETSLPTRVAHATVSYVWYAWKTVWPTGLAMFYPYPTWATWQVTGAALVVVAAVALAVASWRRAPWVTVGLAWWAIALFPVSGVFQAGMQGMADRFTYVPAIGLFVAVVWTLDAWARTPRARAALRRMRRRRDGGARGRVGTAGRVVARRPDALRTDARGHDRQLDHRGRARQSAPRRRRAATRLRALRPRARDRAALREGRLRHGRGGEGSRRPDEAAPRYRETLKLDPTFVKADTNLGVLLFAAHRTDEALHHLSEAVRKAPDAPEAVDEPPCRVEAARHRRRRRLRRAARVVVARGRDGSVRPAAATYGAGLMSALLGPRVDAVQLVLRECVADAVQSLRRRRRGRRPHGRDHGAVDAGRRVLRRRAPHRTGAGARRSHHSTPDGDALRQLKTGALVRARPLESPINRRRPRPS
jgi:hypothetical protein